MGALGKGQGGEPLSYRYETHSIRFKVFMDDHGLFNGSDEAAMKAGSNDLRASCEYFKCHIPDLGVPLQVMGHSRTPRNTFCLTYTTSRSCVVSHSSTGDHRLLRLPSFSSGQVQSESQRISSSHGLDHAQEELRIQTPLGHRGSRQNGRHKSGRRSSHFGTESYGGFPEIELTSPWSEGREGPAVEVHSL